MTAGKTIAGLSLLCALAISGVAAADASASPGWTNVTCKKVASGGEFRDAHCTESASGSTGEYTHETLPVETTTAIRGQNLNTAGARIPSTLSSVVAGIAVEIKCEVIEITGDVKNVTPHENEMQIHGTEIVFHFKKCTVPKPVGQSCVIPGGEFTFKPATTTSFDNSPTDNGFRFFPEAGEVFAEVPFEKCKTAALNATYPIKGSWVSSWPGATLFTTAPQTEKTMTFAGSPLKMLYEVTIKMYNTLTNKEEDGIASTTIP